MKNKILQIIFPLVLASIAIFICFKNYTPGTYLLGWDSMDPEFNFSLNAQRMLSHVWGGEMGVGAISAHSDMSDLPKILILWLVSIAIPENFIRYFYIFSCLIVGPLGVYFFLKYVFQREKDSVWIYPASFLGGLFYLLNLGTLQNFYVPLEMFTAAFAGVPWLFLFGLKYLRDGKKSSLLSLSLISILISPMAYAATQAYAIYLGFFLFLLSFSILSSGKKLKIKRLLIAGFVTLMLNIYWILPNVYSIIQQSQTISNATINKLFSPEAFLRNADYGNIKNILLQRNFLFGWRNFDFLNSTYKDLLGVWIKYLSYASVLTTGFVLALFGVLGGIVGLIKREKITLSLLPALFVCLFFLLNINPPFGEAYKYLYKNFEVFSEAFRTPFTKFSVLFELIASFYFGYLFYVILSVKAKHLNFLKSLLFLGITGALIYFSLPAFYGEMIGKNVRVKFPEEYKSIFNWFNQNSYGRVALMPINSKYGWEYRDWAYEGSGFLTYGIKNPVLYRDFDRWSVFNEDFYREASRSLYGNDAKEFIFTLKKYQVKYLLLDESIINAGGGNDTLEIPKIKKIADGSMRLAEKFGFLTIYDTGFGNEEISAPSSLINDADKTLVKGTLLLKEDLFVNRGFENAYNCDLKKVGKVTKENSGAGILYEAFSGGVSCDYLNFPDLKYDHGYILRIAGENRSGRSLKIYLINTETKMADVEDLLPEGKFDKEYYIYPSKVEGSGYLLNFETRSFGRIASENLVTNVEIYNATPSAALESSEYAVQNNLQIQSVKKYGTWGYRVNAFGDGLLVLGQGYEKGWIAFQIQDSRFKIQDHVKLNSWANGWNINKCQMINDKCQIYIFYWPQVPEWAGLLAGGVTLLILILKKR